MQLYGSKALHRMEPASNQDDEEEQQRHRHHHSLHDRAASECAGRGDRVAVDRALSAKWAAFYPDESIAVVTSASKPPLPPHGTAIRQSHLSLLSASVSACGHELTRVDGCVYLRLRAASCRPRASE